MHNAIAVVFVLAMIILPCMAIVLAGVWATRRLRKSSPTSQLLQRSTPVELLLTVCLVVTFIAGAVVRQLYPQGTLGAILNNPVGLVAAFLLVIITYALAHAVLTVLLRHRAR